MPILSLLILLNIRAEIPKNVDDWRFAGPACGVSHMSCGGTLLFCTAFGEDGVKLQINSKPTAGLQSPR